MRQPKSRGPMPPLIRERWEQTLAATNREEIAVSFARCEAAAAEATFSGFLRRAMHGAGKPITLLERESGVSGQRLVEFLEGRGELDSREIDHIMAALGNTLVAEA